MRPQQNNMTIRPKNPTATTPEQSERLIKAGVKRETADMHWITHCARDEDGNYHDVLFNGCLAEHYLPAWSFAALWRLAAPLGLSFATDEDTPEAIIEHIVKHFEDL